MPRQQCVFNVTVWYRDPEIEILVKSPAYAILAADDTVAREKGIKQYLTENRGTRAQVKFCEVELLATIDA